MVLALSQDAATTETRRCSTAPARRRAQPTLPDWLTQRRAGRAAPLAPLSPSRLYDETAPIGRAGGASAAAGAGARRRRAPAAAVAAGRSPPDAARRGRAPLSRAARAETSPPPSATRSRAGARAARRSALRRAVRAGQPGRGADRRPLSHGGTTRAVAGVVDRLVVTADAILIADYKTNRAGAAAARRSAARLRRRSSRSTAPCSPSSIPAGRSAPPWSGPKCLI